MRSTITMLFLLATNLPVFAQDFPNPQPTDAHKILALDEGTWDADVTMHFEDGAKKYKAIETNVMLCGGLYSSSTFMCKMGDRMFEGHGLTGYDARAKQYTGMWVDNFSSAPSASKGTYDAATKTMTTFSTVVGPAGNEMKQKMVGKLVDDDTKTFEIFLLVGGGDNPTEIKLMDYTAKKRK